MSDKKRKRVVWLVEDGTYEDQHGFEHECKIVKQQTVMTETRVKNEKGGYGQTTTRRFYEDPLKREFMGYTDGLSIRGITSFSEIGSGGRRWKRADDRYDGPYLRKDTMKPVKPIEKDDEQGYRFYEQTQLSMMFK